MQINTIHVAHVAESIERLSGGEVSNYNATAEFAANLLHDYPTVQAAVLSFIDDTIGPDEFDKVVDTAAQLAGE
jgi:hypothetical protein